MVTCTRYNYQFTKMRNIEEKILISINSEDASKKAVTQGQNINQIKC
jgi:hypothetical protein